MRPAGCFLLLGFLFAAIALFLALLRLGVGAIAFGIVSASCFLSAALLGRRPR